MVTDLLQADFLDTRMGMCHRLMDQGLYQLAVNLSSLCFSIFSMLGSLSGLELMKALTKLASPMEIEVRQGIRAEEGAFSSQDPGASRELVQPQCP